MTAPQVSSAKFIIDALRKKGYKATSQRIAICQLVLSSREHPTAKRIYQDVKRLHPTVSLATVYKTMQVLGELGVVQELAFTQGEARFDSNVSPHVNAVCLQCGKVSDVNDQAIRKDVTKAASRIKFTVTGQRFDVYGVCEKCGKRRERSAWRN